MTYKEAKEKSKSGKTILLPGFVGHFNWDYSTNEFIFTNSGYRCNADSLDLDNRTDFYYII